MFGLRCGLWEWLAVLCRGRGFCTISLSLEISKQGMKLDSRC